MHAQILCVRGLRFVFYWVALPIIEYPLSLTSNKCNNNVEYHFKIFLANKKYCFVGCFMLYSNTWNYTSSITSVTFIVRKVPHIPAF